MSRQRREVLLGYYVMSPCMQVIGDTPEDYCRGSGRAGEEGVLRSVGEQVKGRGSRAPEA